MLAEVVSELADDFNKAEERICFCMLRSDLVCINSKVVVYWSIDLIHSLYVFDAWVQLGIYQ